MISDVVGGSNGFKDTSPRAQAVLDIFFCHDLFFLTKVGREKRSENAASASAAENLALIPLFEILL